MTTTTTVTSSNENEENILLQQNAFHSRVEGDVAVVDDIKRRRRCSRSFIAGGRPTTTNLFKSAINVIKVITHNIRRSSCSCCRRCRRCCCYSCNVSCLLSLLFG